MTFTAAALPEAMFTAWFNILELGAPAENEIALIHGGTSEVGLARHHDAEQRLVIKSRQPAARLRNAKPRGHSAPSRAFDYHAADLAAQIKAETKKAGLPIGVILDMSAGAHLEDDFEVHGLWWPHRAPDAGQQPEPPDPSRQDDGEADLGDRLAHAATGL